MADPIPANEALAAWRRIPGEIEAAIEGVPESGLGWRGGDDGMSIRETVHHLVEANLVAASIMIAALGKTGCVYDWSWLFPNLEWTQRMGYERVPIGPALATLRALVEHVGGVIAASDGLGREVRLRDSPGAALYTKTVEDILLQEAEHAAEHLRGLAQTRAAQGA
ncbi:MAG TPA: DinB family protein [Vicinamibacteria bacterium]